MSGWIEQWIERMRSAETKVDRDRILFESLEGVTSTKSNADDRRLAEIDLREQMQALCELAIKA